MPDYTKNYNFIKPKKTEKYDIDDVTRKNMDIADTELFNKQDKEPGKGLSTNDFTNAYKDKVDGFSNYDDTNIKKLIESNTSKIEQNTKNIEANTSNISKNTKSIETNAKNIDTNTKNIASNTKKIESNTDAIEKNSKSIEELTAENTALKEELERQKEDNKLNGLTEDNEGELVHIENTTGARFNSLEICGNEKQETREGKNLYNVYDTEGRNFNSTLLKIDDEDKISLEDYTNSSDVTKWVNFETNINQEIKANTDYYVVTEIFNVNGEGRLTTVSLNASPSGQFATSVSYNFSALAAGDVKIAQITSREDLSTCVSMLRSFLQFTAGQGGSISFRVSVLEKSVTAEDFKYERYGESPSFNYLSEIKTVENSINLKICNKNLNDNNYELGTLSSTTGAEIASSTTLRSKDYLKIKPNTNYSVILEKISELNPTSYSFRCYDRQKKFLETIAFGLISSTSKTLNIKNSNVAYVRLLTFNNKDISNYELSIQIEEGAVATDIVAHEEQNYIIPVQQRMFSGDKFVKVDGHWKEMHTMGEVTSQNNQNISVGTHVNSETFNRYSLYLGSIGKKVGAVAKILSNYFKYANSRWTEAEGVYNWENGQNFCIGTFNKNFDTADKLKTFLLNNPVIFYYELAEPLYIDCTKEQIEVLEQIEQATTYKEVTNVYTEDEIGAIIKTNTNVDLSKMINNVVEAQLSQIGG